MIRAPQSFRSAALIVLSLIACCWSISPMWDFNFPCVDLGERLLYVREVLAGKIIYRDIFSHHFMGYLIPFSAYFAFVPFSKLGIWALAILHHFLTATGVALTLRELTNKTNYGLLALFFYSTIGWTWNWGGHWFNNQNFFLPIFSFWIWLVVKSLNKETFEKKYWSNFSALILGILSLYDIRLLVLLPIGLLFYGVSLKNKENRSFIINAINFFMSWAIFPALTLLYLGLNHSLGDFVFETIWYPVTYKNNGIGNQAIESSLKLVSWIFRGEPLLTICAFLSLGLITLKAERYISRFLLMLFIAAILYIIGAGRDRPNYLLILNPIFCSTIVYGIYLAQRHAQKLSFLLRILFGVSIIWSVSLPLQIYWKTGSLIIAADERAIKTASDEIRLYTTPEDEVLLVGHGMGIYLLSNRTSSFNDLSLVSVAGANFHSEDSRKSTVKSMQDKFSKYLAEHSPKVILYYYATGKEYPINSLYSAFNFFDGSKTYPLLNFNPFKSETLVNLRQKIESEYVLKSHREFERDGYDLYELNNP